MSQDQGPEKSKGQPGIRQAALFGLCPRCGEKTLFASGIQFAPECRVCGLSFSEFNVGDGPAGFLTLIIGAVMVGLAIWLDIAASPPFWLHALIFVPLTIVAVVGGLRVCKAALLAAEYANKAGEASAAPSSEAVGQDNESGER